MTSIALIGTGIIGRGMADNLLGAGHRVRVWNRTAANAEPLVKAGADLASSPAEAVAGADVVFEVTADDASSRQVWLGPDGILAAVSADATCITSATLSVGWIEELAAACGVRDVTFLDMPITGGSAAAAAGTMTMLVGGPAAALDAVRPVLEAISARIHHFGPVGAGTKFKLVLNALQAVHMVGFGEAMRIATAAGLDPRQVGEALVERPGGPITQMAWNAYGRAEVPVGFSLSWARKDVGYALGAAGDVTVEVIADVYRALDRAFADGHADEDWTTVIQPR